MYESLKFEVEKYSSNICEFANVYCKGIVEPIGNVVSNKHKSFYSAEVTPDSDNTLRHVCQNQGIDDGINWVVMEYQKAKSNKRKRL